MLFLLNFTNNLYREQIAESMNVSVEELELQYGLMTLADEEFVADCGVEDEGEISVHMALDGGMK